MVRAPVVWVWQNRGQTRRLRAREMRGVGFEIGFRCGLGTVIAVAPIHQVEISGEDALLGHNPSINTVR